LYFGAWEATTRYGVIAIGKGKPGWGSPFPLVVRKTVTTVWGGYSVISLEPSTTPIEMPTETTTTEHYLWLFGPTFRLPFESAP
jgi:hypothetical protein